MLVGHNPTMEEVLERVDRRTRRWLKRCRAAYPPAGLAVLDYRGFVAGADAAWTLTDFVIGLTWTRTALLCGLACRLPI
jgi:phosphohistidine phosphatase